MGSRVAPIGPRSGDRPGHPARIEGGSVRRRVDPGGSPGHDDDPGPDERSAQRSREAHGGVRRPAGAHDGDGVLGFERPAAQREGGRGIGESAQTGRVVGVECSHETGGIHARPVGLHARRVVGPLR
jgi:hypothetical protein